MSIHDAEPGTEQQYTGGVDQPPSQRNPGSSGGSLTRVTANFTPRATAALERIAAKTGDSKTDILNRSIMVYAVFLELMGECDGPLRVVYPDDSVERLVLIG